VQSLNGYGQDTATTMVDVLHAVQYLHEIGLVHRDLKVMPAISSYVLALTKISYVQMENLMYASDDPDSPDYFTVKVPPPQH
jgi:serine/threonine protein kinase